MQSMNTKLEQNKDFCHGLYKFLKLTDNIVRHTHIMENRIFTPRVWLLVIVFILSTIAVIASTAYFTPTEIGPAGITFWFLGILIASGSLIAIVDYSVRMRKEINQQRSSSIYYAALRAGFLVGFTLTVLLALSSLRSLSLRDIILFVLTVVLIEFFFRTRKA